MREARPEGYDESLRALLSCVDIWLETPVDAASLCRKSKYREHYDAIPRETYFHMVTYLCDVAPGQAALTILPGSHHRTYAAAAELCSHEELQQYSGQLGQSGGPFEVLKQDPVRVAGLDPTHSVEVIGSEGDCVICEQFEPLRIKT